MSGCGERFSNGSTSCAGKRRTDSAASDPVNSQAERMAAWRASAALLAATRLSDVVFPARTNNGRYNARAVKVRPETRLRPLPALRWRRTRSKGTEFSRSASSSRTKGRIIAGLSLPAATILQRPRGSRSRSGLGGLGFGVFFGAGSQGLGLRVVADDDLAVFEQGHHANAAADVAGNRGQEPLREGEPWDAGGEDGGEYLSAGSDAVGEVPQADDEGEHPDDHDRAGDGVRSGDQPGDAGDDPSPHDAGPEDGGAGMVRGIEAELAQGLDGCGGERVRERGKRGEGERSEDVEGQHDGPEAHGVPEVALFREDEGDRVEGVLGEEL